jgi:predicted permease
MLAIGFVIGMVTSGGDLGVGGLYGMYMQLGNDVAFGVPLISNLYPALMPYLFMMLSVSELIFNPISYFLFEYSHHVKTGGDVNLRQIAFNVFAEPMVIFALFGICCNAAFNIGLKYCHDADGLSLKDGDSPENCELPEFMEMAYKTIGGAFVLVALLSFGLNLYGKESALQGRAALMPLGLTVLRIVLLPTLAMMNLKLFGVTLKDSGSFAFLYCLFPAGPGCIVMAVYYSLPVDEIAGCLLLSTVLSAPMMFIGIGLIDINPYQKTDPGNAYDIGAGDSFPAVIDLTKEVCSRLSLAGVSWIVLSFLLSLWWGGKARQAEDGTQRASEGSNSVEMQSMADEVDDGENSVHVTEMRADSTSSFFQSTATNTSSSYSPTRMLNKQDEMHKFPSLQIVMISFALFIFLAPLSESNINNLEYGGVQDMNTADFFCLTGGFARSLLSPVIAYQLQSGMHNTTTAYRKNLKMYMVAWAAALGAAAYVFYEQREGNTATYTYVKIVYDVFGLVLILYSCVKLVGKVRRGELAPLESSEVREHRMRNFSSLRDSVDCQYNEIDSPQTQQRKRSARLVAQKSFRGMSMLGLDPIPDTGATQMEAGNRKRSRPGSLQRRQSSNKSVASELGGGAMPYIPPSSEGFISGTGEGGGSGDVSAPYALMEDGVAGGAGAGGAGADKQHKVHFAGASKESLENVFGGPTSGGGEARHESKVTKLDKASLLLGDSVYFRLGLCFLIYVVYTIISLTYHLYGRIFHQKYVGVAKVLLFLRLVVGHSIGIFLFLLFGLGDTFTRPYVAVMNAIISFFENSVCRTGYSS